MVITRRWLAINGSEIWRHQLVVVVRPIVHAHLRVVRSTSRRQHGWIQWESAIQGVLLLILILIKIII